MMRAGVRSRAEPATCSLGDNHVRRMNLSTRLADTFQWG
jgi:hypothetical protein